MCLSLINLKSILQHHYNYVVFDTSTHYQDTKVQHHITYRDSHQEKGETQALILSIGIVQLSFVREE